MKTPSSFWTMMAVYFVGIMYGSIHGPRWITILAGVISGVTVAIMSMYFDARIDRYIRRQDRGEEDRGGEGGR